MKSKNIAIWSTAENCVNIYDKPLMLDIGQGTFIRGIGNKTYFGLDWTVSS